MRIDIVNGSVVTGDGQSFLEDTSVIIEDCLIADLPRVRYIQYNLYADRYIDARGGLILPGIINIHAHNISFAPVFASSCRRRIPKERVLFNLNTHLLQGTTTLLNDDGFAMPYEIEAVNKIHPVTVKTSTLHTPKNVRVAEITDGEALDDRNKRFTAEEALAFGAVAIGEVGPPTSSYGTFEKSRKLGKAISAQNAKALDTAVLAGDEARIRKALIDLGLESMSVEQGKKLVEETTILGIEAGRDAIKESVGYVKKLNIPVLVHTESYTREVILEAAQKLGSKLVALHVNNHFSPRDAIEIAKALRSAGAILEVSTMDFFSVKQVEASPETTFALLKEGLVDVITTDYSGGYHEPILLVLQKAIEERIITLPHAIQLATSAPARIVPRLAPNKGLIEPGRVADLCVVDRNDISKVRHVIIAGRVVVEDGKIVV